MKKLFTLLVLVLSMIGLKAQTGRILNCPEHNCQITWHVRSDSAAANPATYGYGARISDCYQGAFDANTELVLAVQECGFHSPYAQTNVSLTAATVISAGAYQICNQNNCWDLRLQDVPADVLYRIYVDTVAHQAYGVVERNSGEILRVRPLLPGVSGFETEPLAWEKPKRIGNPGCDNDFMRLGIADTCPNAAWSLIREQIIVVRYDTCPQVRGVDSTLRKGVSDDVRWDVSGDGFSSDTSDFCYQVHILINCDGTHETWNTRVLCPEGPPTIHTCECGAGTPSAAVNGLDTFEIVWNRGATSVPEFDFQGRLGQLTTLKLRIGGYIPLNAHLAIALHAGVQLAPASLDYGKRNTVNADSVWGRGFGGFLGDGELIWSMKPTASLNPQVVMGLQGEFGATELSYAKKSPANIFTANARVHWSPYAVVRFAMRQNVSVYAGFNFKPYDYFNPWIATDQGGDHWSVSVASKAWEKAKVWDLMFGLNLQLGSTDQPKYFVPVKK